MGILTNVSAGSSSQNTGTTKRFYFGMPEAEGENKKGHKLLDYFDDYLNVLEELAKGKFIFIGRKGSGKSAIAKYIKDKSDTTSDSFAALLRLNDFNLEKNVQDNISSECSSIQLFEWLILINIVKLIVKNECGQHTPEYKKLRKFVERNMGSVDIDKFEIGEMFIKSGGDVNFGVLTHCFGGVFKKYFDVHTTKAPFYKLIQPLKEVVKIILDQTNENKDKNKEFWLLFDDLDVDYDVNNDSDNQKIMDLLRIAKLYNNEVFQNKSAKILVFLREDMSKIIQSKYNDSGKTFLSYGIHLKWYIHDLLATDENAIPLKKMTNRRLAINFKNNHIKYDESDPWSSMFSEKDINRYLGEKSSFKYILDFTLYRPRDIIIFLSTICDKDYPLPINAENLKSILYAYIKKLRVEIESELSLHFTSAEKDNLFQYIFQYIVEKHPNKSELLQKISQYKFVLSPEEVFSILEEYALIGYQNQNGESFFNFREKILTENEKSTMSIVVPKCIFYNYKKIR